MPTKYLRGILAASWLTMSLSAMAATVQVEAFIRSTSADNVVTNPTICTPGSTLTTECVSFAQTIGLGSPTTDTGTVTHLRSTFDNGNVSQVPNFVLNGNARAFADFGQLHASTFVQIQGAGGNNVSMGGRSFAQLTDLVTVHSSVLPVGSPVTVKMTMDVSGVGGGWMSFGINAFVQRVGVATDSGGDALQDYETTYSAKVGDRFRVVYGLAAYARTVSTAWGPANVLNGRNNSSDYGNSVHLYMGGLDPSLGVTLQNDNGFTYATSAVPEPAATWLLLTGLPVLAWRARRRHRTSAN
ncbi:PEP-CTERM sorting domain-containing protein [Roseateles sp.]|uniref:PEP-CTERM sorting domain-containing protein n=1 Tax=Roseateles sp. TaxID=1971397 RepID=UPI0032665B40